MHAVPSAGFVIVMAELALDVRNFWLSCMYSTLFVDKLHIKNGILSTLLLKAILF